MALVNSLQREVMSNDTWYLASGFAVDQLKEIGMSEETIKEIFQRLENVRRANRAKNPLSSMFDF